MKLKPFEALIQHRLFVDCFKSKTLPALLHWINPNPYERLNSKTLIYLSAYLQFQFQFPACLLTNRNVFLYIFRPFSFLNIQQFHLEASRCRVWIQWILASLKGLINSSRCNQSFAFEWLIKLLKSSYRREQNQKQTETNRKFEPFVVFGRFLTLFRLPQSWF